MMTNKASVISKLDTILFSEFFDEFFDEFRDEFFAEFLAVVFLLVEGFDFDFLCIFN